MSSPILARRAHASLKHARRLSVSDAKPNDGADLPRRPSRSFSSSSSDKPPTVSRGMATLTPIPQTSAIVSLQQKCPVTKTEGLSVKPSPIVTFDGAGPFSSPCVGLDFTVTERPSTDAVALRYKFRSSSQAESAQVPAVDVPLTSPLDWTRVRMGTTELEYQSSPLTDDSSPSRKAVVRTKMTTTTPSLSSVKVHSVFIVQSTPGAGPQVQHVLPSHPLFHDV